MLFWVFVNQVWLQLRHTLRGQASLNSAFMRYLGEIFGSVRVSTRPRTHRSSAWCCPDGSGAGFCTCRGQPGCFWHGAGRSGSSCSRIGIVPARNSGPAEEIPVMDGCSVSHNRHSEIQMSHICKFLNKNADQEAPESLISPSVCPAAACSSRPR